MRVTERQQHLLLGMRSPASIDVAEAVRRVKKAADETKSITFKCGYAGAHRVEAAEKTEKKS